MSDQYGSDFITIEDEEGNMFDVWILSFEATSDDEEAGDEE